ncbi:hypothetical protein BC835DRAFT_1076976 [Cytidiella melzeri]|nr:hypothetical protein BC835DRAFT_1076976 [Cytidiella melzeri]
MSLGTLSTKRYLAMESCFSESRGTITRCCMGRDGDGPALRTSSPVKWGGHVPGRSGVCCEELKDDDRKTLVDAGVVRDVVIYPFDGLTDPFPLAAVRTRSC